MGQLRVIIFKNVLTVGVDAQQADAFLTELRELCTQFNSDGHDFQIQSFDPKRDIDHIKSLRKDIPTLFFAFGDFGSDAISDYIKLNIFPKKFNTFILCQTSIDSKIVPEVNAHQLISKQSGVDYWIVPPWYHIPQSGDHYFTSLPLDTMRLETLNSDKTWRLFDQQDEMDDDEQFESKIILFLSGESLNAEMIESWINMIFVNYEYMLDQDDTEPLGDDESMLSNGATSNELIEVSVFYSDNIGEQFVTEQRNQKQLLRNLIAAAENAIKIHLKGKNIPVKFSPLKQQSSLEAIRKHLDHSGACFHMNAEDLSLLSGIYPHTEQLYLFVPSSVAQSNENKLYIEWIMSKSNSFSGPQKNQGNCIYTITPDDDDLPRKSPSLIDHLEERFFKDIGSKTCWERLMECCQSRSGYRILKP